MKTTIVALGLSLALCAAASAQVADTTHTIKNSTLDTSVPESPAFTVLGVTPSTITRPASPRQLASSLLNGVDKNGNFQTGIALDMALYMLFYGNQILLKDYQTNRVVQVLSRTQVSLATTKGASDADKSAKLAIGVNLAIFDKGDPRLNRDYVTALATVAVAVQNAQPALSPLATPEDIKARKDKLEAAVDAQTKAIRAQYQKTSWNRSSWTVAAAPSWISQDGSATNLAANGAAVWTSLAYGFENVPGLKDNAQLVLHTRFHSNEAVPDPNKTGSTFQQQSTVAGASLRLGTSTTIVSFEGAYIHTRPVDRAADDYLRISLGAEERLSDNVWLHFSVGGESGQKNGQNKLFILGAFKWAAGPKE